MGYREKIIESATDLIHLKGYNSTTVDDILSATGAKKSNFYYHFKSKEEMALVALEERMEKFSTEVLDDTLKNKSLSPKDKLRLFYESIVEYQRNMNCTKGCPFGNLATEMSDLNEAFRTRLSKFFQMWENLLKHCLAEGAESGDFKSDINPKQLASLILSHLEGAIMLTKTHKTLEPLSQGTLTILNLIETK